MPLSTPSSSAWRLDTDLPNSPWPIRLRALAVMVALACLLVSDTGLLLASALLLFLVLCLLRERRLSRRPVHLRATPAILRVTMDNDQILHLLPPWRTVVWPALIAVQEPGRFGRGRWLHFYRHQFEEDDWRKLRVIVKQITA